MPGLRANPSVLPPEPSSVYFSWHGNRWCGPVRVGPADCCSPEAPSGTGRCPIGGPSPHVRDPPDVLLQPWAMVTSRTGPVGAEGDVSAAAEAVAELVVLVQPTATAAVTDRIAARTRLGGGGALPWLRWTVCHSERRRAVCDNSRIWRAVGSRAGSTTAAGCWPNRGLLL